jgi:hypothetical protein
MTDSGPSYVREIDNQERDYDGRDAKGQNVAKVVSGDAPPRANRRQNVVLCGPPIRFFVFGRSCIR